MTITQIVDGLREMIRQTSDDSNYTDEYLFFVLNNARSQIMYQYINDNKDLSAWLYQRFCIKLCPSTFMECNCVPFDFACTVYRSEFPLPKPISSNSNDILKISELFGDHIGKVSESSNRYVKHRMHKSNMYYMIGDVRGQKYLFILSNKNIPPKYIKAEGIFQDPSEVEYAACTEEQCFNPQGVGFPIENHLVNGLYKMALEFLGVSLKMPEDISNNSNSSNEFATK